MRWAELEDEERKQWARKAESVCSSSVQQVSLYQYKRSSNIIVIAIVQYCTCVQELQPAPLGVQNHTPSQQQGVVAHLLTGTALEMNAEVALVEKTLLAIQDKVRSCCYACYHKYGSNVLRSSFSSCCFYMN